MPRRDRTAGRPNRRTDQRDSCHSACGPGLRVGSAVGPDDLCLTVKFCDGQAADYGVSTGLALATDQRPRACPRSANGKTGLDPRDREPGAAPEPAPRCSADGVLRRMGRTRSRTASGSEAEGKLPPGADTSFSMLARARHCTSRPFAKAPGRRLTTPLWTRNAKRAGSMSSWIARRFGSTTPRKQSKARCHTVADVYRPLSPFALRKGALSQSERRH